mgnify:FL=1
MVGKIGDHIFTKGDYITRLRIVVNMIKQKYANDPTKLRRAMSYAERLEEMLIMPMLNTDAFTKLAAEAAAEFPEFDYVVPNVPDYVKLTNSKAASDLERSLRSKKIKLASVLPMLLNQHA